jgi:predicted secreted hydrolase
MKHDPEKLSRTRTMVSRRGRHAGENRHPVGFLDSGFRRNDDDIRPFIPRNSTTVLSMAYRAPKTVLFMLVLAAFAAIPRAQAEDGSYYAVTGPCNLSFPGDHGPHPGYRTEWWYYTGNLHSDKGDPYGFQLTFFRRQISLPGADKTWPEPASAWRTQQIFLAHAALTDITNKHFYHAEEMSRGMPELADARREAGRTKIFVKGWSLNVDEEGHLLEAKSGNFGFNLRLKPVKPPVLHGEAGYSPKGAAPESASCYYSFSRLQTEGLLSIAGTEIPVLGTAWMDHEFSSAPLEPDVTGWDWFSLQLSHHTELMVYLLRKKDGTYSAASSGTFVDASGRALPLRLDDLLLQTLDHWTSPRTGAVYPSGWRLVIQPLELELNITPSVRDQELETPGTTNITYWEGSVSVSGNSKGQDISGEGYVELTGYAGAMAGRM